MFGRLSLNIPVSAYSRLYIMSMLLCFKQVFLLAEVGVLGLLLMLQLFNDTKSEPRATTDVPWTSGRPEAYFLIFFKSGQLSLPRPHSKHSVDRSVT